MVNAVDYIVNIGKILHNEHAVFRQKLQKRNLFSGQRGQFGHDFCLVPSVFRQLVLHFKGANGVDFPPEEVDTERIFATERIDIENASTHGKLPGLVNIVHFLKAIAAQGVLHFGDIHLPSDPQRQSLRV